MDHKPTPEQDELFRNLASTLYDSYTTGGVDRSQLLHVFMAWNGATDSLGWDGVASSLKNDVRGSLAYVLGHRYVRLHRQQDAIRFFATAIAESSGESTLHRLSELELDRLKTTTTRPR